MKYLSLSRVAGIALVTALCSILFGFVHDREIQKSLEVAVERYSMADFDGTILICQKILAERPYCTTAKKLLARSFSHRSWKQDCKAAISSLENAISIDPKPVDYNHKAVLNYSEGNFSAALSDVDKAICLSPQTSFLYSMRKEIVKKLLDSKSGKAQ